MQRGAVILLCVLSLPGCATLTDKWHTTVQEDNRRGTKPERYQDAINTYLGNTLKDPFTAQQRDLKAPIEAVYTKRTVTQAPTLVNTQGYILESRRLAWLVTVQVNAKNSYGGYIGWKPYQFYFQGEQLIATESGS